MPAETWPSQPDKAMERRKRRAEKITGTGEQESVRGGGEGDGKGMKREVL